MAVGIRAPLITLCAHAAYITHPRSFLIEHPLLALEIGFRPVSDAAQPYGVDIERTLPGARGPRHMQQHLDNGLLDGLPRGAIWALRAAIPGLGETVSFHAHR